MGSHRAERRGRGRLRHPAARGRGPVRDVGASTATFPPGAGRRISEVDPTTTHEDGSGANDPSLQRSPGVRRAPRRGRSGHFREAFSAPLLGGIVAMVISTTGAVTEAANGPPGAGASQYPLAQASAPGGNSAVSNTSLIAERRPPVSRNFERDSPRERLVRQAERQVQVRNMALRRLSEQAAAQSARIEQRLWVLPLDTRQITAEFGQYGLWSSYHTGIDFNGDLGDPIKAIAGGVVTSASFEGAYGNKAVITLADGTEIWYAHQNGFAVNVGEVIQPGEVIGYVGATGNVTGSHLHLEVRPGAGDPVDPRPAFGVHGIDL